MHDTVVSKNYDINAFATKTFFVYILFIFFKLVKLCWRKRTKLLHYFSYQVVKYIKWTMFEIWNTSLNIIRAFNTPSPYAKKTKFYILQTICYWGLLSIQRQNIPMNRKKQNDDQPKITFDSPATMNLVTLTGPG